MISLELLLTALGKDIIFLILLSGSYESQFIKFKYGFKLKGLEQIGVSSELIYFSSSNSDINKNRSILYNVKFLSKISNLLLALWAFSYSSADIILSLISEILYILCLWVLNSYIFTSALSSKVIILPNVLDIKVHL